MQTLAGLVMAVLAAAVGGLAVWVLTLRRRVQSLERDLQEARALGLQVYGTVGDLPEASHAARAAMHCGALLGTDRVVEALSSAEQAGVARAAIDDVLRSALLPWLLG